MLALPWHFASQILNKPPCFHLQLAEEGERIHQNTWTFRGSSSTLHSYGAGKTHPSLGQMFPIFDSFRLPGLILYPWEQQRKLPYVRNMEKVGQTATLHHHGQHKSEAFLLHSSTSLGVGKARDDGSWCCDKSEGRFQLRMLCVEGRLRSLGDGVGSFHSGVSTRTRLKFQLLVLNKRR